MGVWDTKGGFSQSDLGSLDDHVILTVRDRKP